MDNDLNIVPKEIEESIQQYLEDIVEPHKNYNVLNALVSGDTLPGNMLECNGANMNRGYKYDYDKCCDTHYIRILYECMCGYVIVRMLRYIEKEGKFILDKHIILSEKGEEVIV